MSLLTDLKERIILMLTKAIIKKVKEGNDQLLATVDLGHGDVINDVELLQQFGFVSIPEDGAQAITASLCGDREHTIIINTDDSKYRIEVGQGNTAIYNSAGSKVVLKGNSIEIVADNVDIKGANIKLGTTTKALFTEAFQTIFNTHTHVCASPGSPSAVPVPLSTFANLTVKTKAE